MTILRMPLPFHRLAWSLLLCTATATGFAAGSLSGVVTNRTTGKPAVGDDVVLIRLAQGMQEAGRTKTDAKGKYTLPVPDDGLHMVRVTHDKANYFQPVQDTTQAVDVDVFNAAAKVKGVSTEANVMKVETDADGKSLRVVESFFIKNESDPQMTQFSDKPFDFYLPPGAVMEGSAALAPGGMPVQAAPVPLSDSANHFTFIFPLRPGETRFQMTYKLPYSGTFTFAPRLTSITGTVAVMMPKSMTFLAGASAPYGAVNDNDIAGQTYVVQNVAPSQPLDFTVSGSGQLPRDTPAATTGASDAAAGTGQTQGAAAGSVAADTRPGGGLGNPIDPEGTNDPWAKYKWWIIGGLGLAMAAGAGFMLKGPNPAGVLANGPVVSGAGGSAGGAAAVASGPGAMLQVLKDELFELETERLAGRLSDTEYAEQKTALEVVLRRALGRVDGAASKQAEAEAVTTVV